MERYYGTPYLVNPFSEINMLANSMQNHIGLRYTTLFINYNCQTQGNNAVNRSTVNLAFRILLLKITKIHKIQQGTKNYGKWKEARYQQVK